MDELRIDSHKLMYHVDRVYQWSQGRDIYPIYMEISPSGSCNHRCIFCALDYLEYKPAFLDTKVLKKFLRNIADKGVKSIMFAGEGEPLLHKDIGELIGYAKNNGLDVAVTTNGTMLSKDLAENILSHLSWLRVSLNAGTPKTYSLIHKTNPQDFDKVIKNIKGCVKLKREKKYSCTIGVQCLLVNENAKEILTLAKMLHRIGVDYLIIKPYSQHPRSYNRLKNRLSYDKFSFLEDELKDYLKNNTKGDFRLIFRKKTISKLAEKRPYKKCLGFSFWAYLSSQGDLYACSAFLGNKDFCYGNISEESFEKIWHSKRRKRFTAMMRDKWDIKNCREVCRLDEINRYLWELKTPPPHVNFI